MIENRRWYSFELRKVGMDGNMEIDYERLTNAIVQALEISRKAEIEPQQESAPKFTIMLALKAIWGIMRGKIDTNGEMTVGVFAILVASIFRLLSLAGLAITCVFGYFFVKAISCTDWMGVNILANLIEIVCGIVIIIASLVYTFILWIASNEMMKEKDKGFVVGVFSGVVALAALVVSLIQLLGVG